VPIVPNQPLTFDFNPLDLKAAEQAGDLILTFPDGAQVTLHDIIGPCGPQPAPFELPDGTVITRRANCCRRSTCRSPARAARRR